MCAFSLFLSIFRPYGIFAQAGTTFNLNMEEKWVRKEVADRWPGPLKSFQPTPSNPSVVGRV